MLNEILDNTITEMKRRMLPEGGLADRIGGDYRPDATAWAALAFKVCGQDDGMIQQLQARLAAGQLDDGRVCISQMHHDAFWPTSLAILAWHKSTDHINNQKRAIDFLLHTSGRHWEKSPDSPVVNDPSIQGWPWIENTSSWVEPTALAMIALRTTGYEKHPRAIEAIALLMDRQLPKGGWNYGNTIVYGKELHSMPGLTGIALQAVAGLVSKEQIEKSLIYLKTDCEKLYTPFALGWSLLGVSAWSERPTDAQTLIRSSLARQKRYGPYPTSLLSLLVLASICKKGLISHMKT